MSRILIIEDEISLAGLFRQMFQEAMSIEAEVILDGQEAMTRLENLGTGAPGLIILDMRLPGVSGMDIFEKIAQINAGKKANRIKVFVCSADEGLCRLYRNAADRVFQKPITSILDLTNAASAALAN